MWPSFLTGGRHPVVAVAAAFLGTIACSNGAQPVSGAAIAGIPSAGIPSVGGMFPSGGGMFPSVGGMFPIGGGRLPPVQCMAGSIVSYTLHQRMLRPCLSGSCGKELCAEDESFIRTTASSNGAWELGVLYAVCARLDRMPQIALGGSGWVPNMGGGPGMRGPDLWGPQQGARLVIEGLGSVTPTGQILGQPRMEPINGTSDLQRWSYEPKDVSVSLDGVPLELAEVNLLLGALLLGAAGPTIPCGSCTPIPCGSCTGGIDARTKAGARLIARWIPRNRTHLERACLAPMDVDLSVSLVTP